jgi:hypothetical protein
VSSDFATTSDGLTAPGDSAVADDVALEPMPAKVNGRLAAVWERIEPLLIHASDWVNPILVKETRQALKSFQFTTTFALLLVACWVVTIGVVAWIGPSIFYAAAGGTMLWWYYAILAFPLAVVVPYSAFRSLAAEREDNTYDLVTITTLKPWQIISGKLGSAIVQMAVYFSALTPCVAFTYLLRGVDLPTITVLLSFTFFGSLGLSMIGILLATLCEQRFAQVFVSVALVAGLLWVLGMVLVISWEIIPYSYAMMGGDEFWVVTLALGTFYVTTFALMFFAAAGMITFSTENRSTPLRIAMVVQQAAFVGWMAFAWIFSEFDLEPILVMAFLAGMYWYAMGTLLTAERAGMSQRVKRRLPKSFLGRALFSWFNPGPASGYMFVVANGTAMVLVCLLAMVASDLLGKGPRSWPSNDELFYSVVVGWGYIVAYLGLGLLLVGVLRRFMAVNMFAAVLIHVIVVMFGAGVPTVVQLMSVELRYVDYTLMQVPNPFWSLVHLADGGAASEGPALAMLVSAAAVCILLLNMPGVVREMQQLRVALPTRVVEDEAELHPPPAELPTSPWEEEG